MHPPPLKGLIWVKTEQLSKRGYWYIYISLVKNVVHYNMGFAFMNDGFVVISLQKLGIEKSNAGLFGS